MSMYVCLIVYTHCFVGPQIQASAALALKNIILDCTEYITSQPALVENLFQLYTTSVVGTALSHIDQSEILAVRQCVRFSCVACCVCTFVHVLLCSHLFDVDRGAGHFASRLGNSSWRRCAKPSTFAPRQANCRRHVTVRGRAVGRCDSLGDRRVQVARNCSSRRGCVGCG